MKRMTALNSTHDTLFRGYERLLSASHYNLPRPPPHLEIAFESYSACPGRFLHIAGDGELYAQRVTDIDIRSCPRLT